MLGEIFLSRFRVEKQLDEGRGWQSWEVRDIINSRRSLLFLFPLLPEGWQLDRLSLAWRLARYREVLGGRIPPLRLGEEKEPFILCEREEGVGSLPVDKPLPPAFQATLTKDLKACARAGLDPLCLDPRSLWRDGEGAPVYLPPAFLHYPGLSEEASAAAFPEGHPLADWMAGLAAAPALEPSMEAGLEPALKAFAAGRPVALALRTGLPGGLVRVREILLDRLRRRGGRQLSDPAAPLFCLDNFARPSCLWHPFWSRTQAPGAGQRFFLLYDADSLEADPILAARVEEELAELPELHRCELHMPVEAAAGELPANLSPERRAFLEILSLLDEPAPLGFLLQLLQVEEDAFLQLLATLDREGLLSWNLASLAKDRHGLATGLASAVLRERILGEIPAARLRELHDLVVGLLEHQRFGDEAQAFYRLRHLHGAGRLEALSRDGVALFERAVAEGQTLAAREIADRILGESGEELGPAALRTFFVFLGGLCLARDDTAGAEQAYRRGLTLLTGNEHFLDQLLAEGGPRPALRRGGDAKTLSALSALSRSLAETSETSGEFGRAQVILERLLDVFSESFPAFERGILYNDLAWILYRKGEHEAAVERCEMALRLFDTARHPAELGQTFNTLGVAHWALGQWREAETYYQKALSLREKAGDPVRVAASLNNLGNLYRMLEQLPLAIEYFQRSMEIKKQLGNDAGYLVSLYNVALSSVEMNDLKMARNQCIECLKINERVGHIQLGAEVQGLLGEIDLVEGRIEEAGAHLEEAIRVCREIGARNELASMYRRLVGVELARDDRPAARVAIERGLAESRNVKSRFEEAQVRLYEGQYHLRLGEAADAVASMEKAADLFSSLDKVEWLARTYSRLGLIHLDQGREERARECLRQATGIIERRKVTVPLGEWDDLQARLQDRLGEFMAHLAGESEGPRLASLYQLLNMMDGISEVRERLDQALELLAMTLPLSRAALLPAAALPGMVAGKLVALRGELLDEEKILAIALPLLDSPALRVGAGRVFLPLSIGGRLLGLVYLETESAVIDSADRDFLSAFARMLALGLAPAETEAGKPATTGVATAKVGSAGAGSARRPRLLGKGRDLQRILKLVAQVKDLDTAVLITGESGTGKEEVARALHFGSHRSERPFVPVNCASIPVTLLESLLFGHERGAYTGATHRHIGFFEEASGGTIFLDEIGEMSGDMQAKLLRVIQEKQFTRLGGTRTLTADIRVLTATHRNLTEEVRAGRFREDLYYRINVISIQIAPLREKREDLPLLAGHFLVEICRSQGLEEKQLSSEVVDLFLKHPWPGNVRQLQNVINNCVILSRGRIIGLEDLPDDFLAQSRRPQTTRSLDELASMVALSEDYSESAPLEGRLLAALAHHLVEHLGSKVAAAKMLGISRPTLYSRLQEYSGGKKLVEPGEMG